VDRRRQPNCPGRGFIGPTIPGTHSTATICPQKDIDAQGGSHALCRWLFHRAILVPMSVSRPSCITTYGVRRAKLGRLKVWGNSCRMFSRSSSVVGGAPTTAEAEKLHATCACAGSHPPSKLAWGPIPQHFAFSFLESWPAAVHQIKCACLARIDYTLIRAVAEADWSLGKGGGPM
jgi:hypothetical protein